ncbi:MAG: type II toxin-antitoxin system RelE/ParE family toxin, partial [Selenomonas sp.]|nr:type II toxin-antitoxin system RelE/ParE family toxin [Selenomonas sp.]
MDKYTVRVYARAYRDLDHIYAYIAEKLLAPDSALSLVSALEEAIYTLE